MKAKWKSFRRLSKFDAHKVLNGPAKEERLVSGAAYSHGFFLLIQTWYQYYTGHPIPHHLI